MTVMLTAANVGPQTHHQGIARAGPLLPFAQLLHRGEAEQFGADHLLPEILYLREQRTRY